ncbi:MAG: N5-glutamine S-adenosyl-L-methionine-dependent methyltransferase [Candidatus Krumholzibacteriota bacterium]|nr:N5-glutamine S-adenosyl-L-methionine-dependent methyltransferase [Candidatus Krumholzibacteriota bacterium]
MLSDVVDIVRWLRESEAYLVERGVPNARRNAEWILGDVLRCRSADLYLNPYRVIDRGERERFQVMLRRRGEREPLQYILESTEFMSLPFRMRRGVFIPRPETELLVEAVEAFLDEFSRRAEGRQPLLVLDLCCGSGVIAVSLAVRRAGLECTAVDADGGAVILSRENAEANGVGRRVRCVESAAADFLRGSTETYHAVVCNPPYVAAGEIDRLLPEVKDYEPRLALDGGADGLDFLREVIPRLPRATAPDGIVAFEIGETQGRAVAELLEGAGFEAAAVRKDYRGLDRVVTARRP